METENKTRVCKVCGRTLPIEEFKLCSGGIKRHTTCLSCEQKYQQAKSSEKFKDFTSRELIEELRYRGYKGELHYVLVEKVVI